MTGLPNEMNPTGLLEAGERRCDCRPADNQKLETRNQKRRPHVVRAYTRRDALELCSGGFGMLALAGLSSLQAEARAASTPTSVRGTSPFSPKQTHIPARAKRVIFIFIGGGPSAVDSFDPKPRLDRESGNAYPGQHPVGIIDPNGKLLKSPWEFKQHGQSGLPVSSLFPEIAKVVDDLCIVRSMHTEGQAHGQAVLKLHTGDAAFVRPSIGSWVCYGLGTENQNLPGFITFSPPLDTGGAQLYGSAFLPAVYQGTAVGQQGSPSNKAEFPYLKNAMASPELQRRQIDLLQEMNRDHLRQAELDSQLEGVIESYELAFRMQAHAPRLLDLTQESKATLDLYGVGKAPTDDFARQCLMARRCVEQGVRFVQINHTKWDQHSNLKGGHQQNAKETDQPVAALIRDLKSRGLLEDTLVLWGGEFGRTPTAEGKDGRDHNPHGFTMWMAGGGVKPGIAYGSTDEYGYYAQENKVHIHDLHATILHLMGMEHTKLTYKYAGRDFRLTDVAGEVGKGILK